MVWMWSAAGNAWLLTRLPVVSCCAMSTLLLPEVFCSTQPFTKQFPKFRVISLKPVVAESSWLAFVSCMVYVLDSAHRVHCTLMLWWLAGHVLPLPCSVYCFSTINGSMSRTMRMRVVAEGL